MPENIHLIRFSMEYSDGEIVYIDGENLQQWKNWFEKCVKIAESQGIKKPDLVWKSQIS